MYIQSSKKKRLLKKDKMKNLIIQLLKESKKNIHSIQLITIKN
jgi:hypothetical protein